MIAVGIRVNTRDALAAIAQLDGLNAQGLTVPAHHLRRAAIEEVPYDTFALLLSIRVVPIKSGGKIMGYSIIAGDDRIIDYASYQESGTRKMAAQPFMWPAQIKTLPEIKAWKPSLPGVIQ